MQKCKCANWSRSRSGDDIKYDNGDEVDETGKNSDAEPLSA